MNEFPPWYPLPRDLLDHLQARLEPTHLRLRLGIEQDREHRVFGQGRNLFHIENWSLAAKLIRATLRLSLTHARGLRNALTPGVNHNFLQVASLPEGLRGMTILHLSDLHLDMHPDLPHVLAEVVQDLRYDLCVLTGDFRFLTHGPCENALAGMQRLRASLRSPVYAVLGNHDSVRMVPGLEAMDIRMLLNESVAIQHNGSSLHLAGVDDPHYYRTDNLERACREIPEEGFSLLLAHTPEIYRHAAHSGFNAMLCGHTHGGQIRLPGGLPLTCNASCPRRYCHGNWQYQQLHGFTSVGAGSSVVAARFNCPPEVVLHTLGAIHQ